MRGIVSAAGYLPFRRLQRAAITETFGTGGGRGTRTVASYDEDTTTMGVEAARLALRSAGGPPVDALWFATADPAYLDKTNATAIHAALRLDGDATAFDLGGAVRSGIGALRIALEGTGTTLVVSADIRTGLPTSPDEAAGGDAAAAVLVGDDNGAGPVIAEYLGAGAATDEFLDRWRTPGDRRTRVWEERFGETKYVPLGEQAWNAALKQASVESTDVARVVVTGMHARAVTSLTKRLGVIDGALVDTQLATIGNAGTAQAGLLLASVLESAGPGELVALVSLADGADVLLLRATGAIAGFRPARPVAAQIDAGADLPYAKFLSWRGMVAVEPPRRPEPARVSASAAGRSEDWKFAFVGSRDRSSGALHLPPARVSAGGTVDDMDPAPMADTEGAIVTFTIDRLAYSPSPPIVFAVVDFDGGGRFPVELTDVDADDVRIGDRVEMTFRRLFTADGIHDYFWKARPIRAAAAREDTR
jgi:3-hydroxy-3-methylglutaryl CoA synthase/uncharacterized OB-fold protein